MISKSDRRVIGLLSVVAVGSICVILFVEALGSGEEKKEGEKAGMVSKDELVTNPDTIRGEKGLIDPNEVDSLTLLDYGLGAMQIRSLMGYRRHGGVFEEPLAVSKLYNWSDADVEKVLPYIKIGDKYKKTFSYREQYEKNVRESYKRNDKKSAAPNHSTRQSVADDYVPKYSAQNKFGSLTKVDINTADTTLLKRIPGVGSGIAGAIVRLREKLGGFHSVDQLAEIKYITPELYEWFAVTSTKGINRININTADFRTLNSHPYISYNQTRDIINYRRLYGEIKDKDALLATQIFGQEEVERLAPYLEY